MYDNDNEFPELAEMDLDIDKTAEITASSYDRQEFAAVEFASDDEDIDDSEEEEDKDEDEDDYDDEDDEEDEYEDEDEDY